MNSRVTEFLSDGNLALLVDMAKREGNLRELTIPSLSNAWLNSNFKLNRVQVFNALIFKELLISLSACLKAKELVSDMLDGYEEACAEDIALEAAFTVFGKKKQLQFVNGKNGRPSPSSSRNQEHAKEDYFSHLPKFRNSPAASDATGA